MKSGLVPSDEYQPFYRIYWDGKDNNKKEVASGVYFVRVDLGYKDIVKKVSLIKEKKKVQNWDY